MISNNNQLLIYSFIKAFVRSPLPGVISTILFDQISDVYEVKVNFFNDQNSEALTAQIELLGCYESMILLFKTHCKILKLINYLIKWN